MFFKWLSFSEKKLFCFLLRLCPIVKSSFNVALLWEFFDIFKFWPCFIIAATIYILGLNKDKYFMCCLKSFTFRKILHSPHYYALENNSTILTKHRLCNLKNIHTCYLFSQLPIKSYYSINMVRKMENKCYYK